MTGSLLGAPLALTLLAGLVVAGFVLRRHTPSAILPLPVVAARWRGDLSSAWALLSGTAVVATLLVVALRVAGTAVAGTGADTCTWPTWNSSAGSGTFPGGALALPVLAALTACALTTGAVLHALPARPAGPLVGATAPLAHTGLLVVLSGVAVLLVPARGVRA